ncbi:fibronectin type III domain-containing protein [Flavobacterium ginsenosidimutans]|uniref:Fibronectin type III domain-containing protein n=1 Tax=Flavobacterium ginsenosidimutans TaxID=687844 RepID=A0ABZ2Q8C3_9FLAO|nr:fibronectin type III domain-containing protein [Flavobacterium ginsenosidimutans]KAF2338995.1 hypothetical protein DM444_00480 [Flavobacterium ginsenosidimutans]
MLKKLQYQLFLTLGFWLSAMVSGIAQTYPVTISTQISQPSPIYLSNYADATTINSPIKVQISLNDLTISNRQIRLKCYFQGQSISLTTNDFVVGARDLYLEGGVPLQLTNVDLAPYFEYQNLLGINPNQYAQALPEGIYNFSVEVYDFATNKKLSKKTSVTTIIFQNDPPFLNLPLNNASIMQQNIQNIIFSWTPRQINVSNVEYEFSLVEIWDKYTPVQNAFLYSPPLFTTTTRSTTLQYGVSEPQLLPGKKYAWRIKAKALQGAEEIGVFKNNGYSEIFSFDYETYCTAPLAINVDGISENQAKVSWSGSIDNFDYQVNYREKNADSEWYKVVTPRENLTITNLKPNTTYEYTVGASCEVGKYTHSTVKEFNTLVRDEIAFQGCGLKPDPADLANTTPLKELLPNDVIAAGDFPIVVLHATGSNGTFSGDGYVTLPFIEKFRQLIDAADTLIAQSAEDKEENEKSAKVNISENTRIRITFNSIGLNTDFKLISGEIIAAYDPNWSSMADLDGVFKDVFGSDGKPVEGKLDYVIESVTLNPDGSTTIKGTNGAVTVLPKSSYDQVYTDKDGKTVTIPAEAKGEPTVSNPAEGGKATAANTNGISSSGEVVQISSSDVKITFSNGTNAKYAFDPQPKDGPKKLLESYETIPTKTGGTYKVSYKAISDLSDDFDFIIAEAEFKNGKTLDDVVFKTNAGEEVATQKISDTKVEIKISKKFNFAKHSIIATVKGAQEKDPNDPSKTIAGKSDIAGKINLWDLTQKPSINITILSVNGANAPSTADAEKFLNDVYNKAGIKFNVTSQNVNITTLPNIVPCGDSGIMNVYTDGQINIINQIEASNLKYDDETYYIIYTGRPGQDGYKGFMPLGGQYAFVFDNNLKTAAHELGHGVFGLKHPFSTDTESGKTDLLMDYGNGTVLSHNDWDIIHSGGWKFYGFQKSSSGADRQANELDLLGNIFKVTENEAASGNILVAQLSEKVPFLITGFNLHQTETKKLLATFIGKVSGKEVVYELSYRDNDYNRVTNIGDKMPYPISLESNGDAVIKILNDQCSYSRKTIYGWKKPENATTENVIEQIKKYLQKDNNFITVALYSADPSCTVVNSLVDLINNDKNKCQPNIVEADEKKLTTLFAKSSFTNTELVDLIVNQQVCISALRKVSWENIKKAFKQLSLSPEIKNDQEIALLRVMVAINSKNVPDFYNLLSANNHEILINLNKELHDHSINPYDNENYTSFYQGLMAMFSINNLDLDRLIPKDDSAAYNFIKNLVPESVTGFDESYYYEYVTNQSVSDKFKMIPVFWKSISNETRKNLIDLAINNNSMFDKSEEILLNLFIHVNDRYGITEELQKNNYSLLWSVYKILDGKERKFFVQDIFYKTLVYNKIPNGYANNLALEVSNKYNTIPPLTEVRKEPYFMFYDQGLFNVVSNNGAVLEYHLLSTKLLSNPSRILFNCSYQVINSKDPKNPIQHLFDLAPYDYVVLEIPKDFTVDGRQFKKGLLAVPAIYAYWMINAVEDHNDAILFRLVADGVAIALAPFTSGGSLLTLELTMVSADILITATNYNNPGAISPKYNAIWDAVYAIYNLPKAVSGLTNLTRGVFQFAVREGKYIETVRVMRSSIKNLVADFQNLNETERLAHLNALDNLVETMSTAMNGGTLNPDEVRVVKKMYDLVTEARLKCQNIDQSLSSIIDITVDNGTILLNNGKVASPAVAEVTISKNIVNLKNIKWQPTNVQNVEIVSTFDKLSYIDKAGQTTTGALSIVEDLNNRGYFYATPKLLGPATLSSRLESSQFALLKSEVNALDSTLKTKFFEDFALANDAILKELDDIVHYNDDYIAFKELWKNSKTTDVKNYAGDIDKFKSWWYPNKAKVNNEFFINQKAFEKALNKDYIEKLNLEKIPSTVRGQYWNNYKQSQWEKLEALAKEYNINFDSKNNALWPPANGGYGALIKRVPNKNEVFDRYSGSFEDLPDGTPNLGGAYTSPMFNGKPYDFDSRALNMERNEYDFYYQIIIKDPSKFEIETNRAIPWFGKVGKGEQSRFIIKDIDPITGYPKTWSQLALEGSVEVIVMESPSGKYATWVGKGRTISKTIASGADTLSEFKALGFTDDVAAKIVAKNKSLNLPETEVKTLMQDLKSNSTLMKAVSKNPDNGIDAWKIFSDNKKPFCD